MYSAPQPSCDFVRVLTEGALQFKEANNNKNKRSPGNITNIEKVPSYKTKRGNSKLMKIWQFSGFSQNGG